MYDMKSVQKQFIKLHVALYFVIAACFLLNRGITDPLSLELNIQIIMGITLLLVVEICVIEFYTDEKWYNIWLLRSLRYLQIIGSLTMYFYAEGMEMFGISILCLYQFFMEFTLTFDIGGKRSRILIYALVLATMMTALFVFSLRSDKESFNLLNEIVIFLVFSMVFLAQSLFLVWQNKEMKEKIQKQKHMISKANEANEELMVHQEELNDTNELLEQQKLKLEEANKQINRSHSEMYIQTKILASMMSSLEIDKLMDLITESIYQKLHVDVAAIFLETDEESQDMPYAIHSRLGNNYKKRLIHLFGKRLYVPYIEENKIWIDNNVLNENYVPIAFKMLSSLILVPLVNEEKRMGVLMVGDCRYNVFTEGNAFFEAIAGQFIIAYKNAQLYWEVKEMAIRDSLTGIYNRRHLTEVYNNKLQEVMMGRNHMSVALFDIDRFKTLNDTYGHLFGDKVIISIAKLAEQTANENEGMVGRFGGEEFVFIFPNKKLRETVQIIQEFHQKIRDLEWECKGETVKIRISIGITSYPETCKNPADLLSHADWAMYHSKQMGRDRITVDFEGMETIQ